MRNADGRRNERRRKREKERSSRDIVCVYRAAENENPTSFEVNLYD